MASSSDAPEATLPTQEIPDVPTNPNPIPVPSSSAVLQPSEPSPLGAVVAVVALLLALVVPIFLLLRTQKADKAQRDTTESKDQARLDAAAAKRQAKLEKGGGKKKKGALARMKKGAPGAAAAADDDDDDDDDDAAPVGQHGESEASRAQREAIKEREAEKDEKRRAREAEREAKERAREEKEREEREAREKKKQEEFEQWSAMFSVEETGQDAESSAQDEGKLGRFVGQIKEGKVTVLEELAAEFGMKVHDVLDRLQSLEAMGHVTGVIDERGKFIFITQEEMQAVAKFVQRKGRIRISTLAQESNRLIDLNSKKVVEEDEADEPEEEAAAAGAA